MILRQLNLGVLSVCQLFYVYCKRKTPFLLNLSFYYCLVKEIWAQKVAYQFTMRGLVAYKKTKRSESIPDFSICRLANVEDFFNVNIFFKCKYVRINDYSFFSIIIMYIVLTNVWRDENKKRDKKTIQTIFTRYMT